MSNVLYAFRSFFFVSSFEFILMFVLLMMMWENFIETPAKIR